MEEQNFAADPAPVVKKESFLARYRGSLWTSLIVLAILTAGLITYILFFRAPSAPPHDKEAVHVSLKAPSEVVSGSQVAYTVGIENTSKDRLTEVKVEVFYPRGFNFDHASVNPADGSNQSFFLPDIAPGESKEVQVIGELSGSVQEIKTASAKLYYLPANFRDRFERESEVHSVILAPELTLKVNAPAQVIVGQTIELSVEVANGSDKTFNEVNLNLVYPEGFQLTRTDPELPDAQNHITWPTVSPGEKKLLKVYGRNTGDAGREVSLQAELVLLQGGERTVAGRSFAFMQLRSSPLRLVQTLKNSGQTIKIGQTLNYEIEYENTGETGLNNVVISLNFASDIFDLSTIRAGEGQYRNGSVQWIPAAVPALLILDPKEKGTFSVTVSVSKNLVNQLKKNPVAETTVSYFSQEVKEAIEGNRLQYKVQTEITLDARAVLVGQDGGVNRYRIELKVGNGVNDVKNTQLTAIAPAGDAQLNQSSIAPAEESTKLTLAPFSGLLHWEIGKIFALAGSFHDSRNLSFEISLSGSSILKDLKITGVDEFTGETIEAPVISEIRPVS